MNLLDWAEEAYGMRFKCTFGRVVLPKLGVHVRCSNLNILIRHKPEKPSLAGRELAVSWRTRHKQPEQSANLSRLPVHARQACAAYDIQIARDCFRW
jgi:hypothetical protein